MPTTLQNELKKIPELEQSALQLVNLAYSLFPNTSLKKKGRRWVFDPNFVTFQVQHARARNIAITLRGNPDEFPHHSAPKLKPDQAGYSIFRFSDPSQLSAASDYIKRAAELYKLGRNRKRL